jgi:hypothetical protein
VNEFRASIQSSVTQSFQAIHACSPDQHIISPIKQCHIISPSKQFHIISSFTQFHVTSPTNAVPLLLPKSLDGIDRGSEVAFIAPYFSAFPRFELARLPPRLLQSVVESTELPNETQPDLFHFIQQFVFEYKNEYQNSAENMFFVYHEGKEFPEFGEHVAFGELSSST